MLNNLWEWIMKLFSWTTLIGVAIGALGSYMGYPWLYTKYLEIGTKEVISRSEKLIAIEKLRWCNAVPLGNEYKQIDKCTAFFVDDMSKQFKGWRQGDEFPLPDLKPPYVINAYELLTKARKTQNLPPLRPLSELSHGALKASGE